MTSELHRNGLMAALWRAQNGRCFHCGDPMLIRVRGNHGRRWSREHLVPRALGGAGAGNVVLAHRACNAARGCSLPSQSESDRARAIYAALELPHAMRANPDFTESVFRALGTVADLWPERSVA